MLHRIALLVALALALAACGNGTPEAEDTPPPEEQVEVEEEEETVPEAALGEGLVVAATVYALAALAEEIAPGADVRLLTASGQDPHDLELSPGDRQLMETADVMLYMGDISFQPQVEAAVAAAGGHVVAVADIAGDGRLRDFEGHADDEGDGHGHDDDDDAGIDPHIWFDATVMADVAEEIGEAFAAVDDARAQDYRDAATALHDELLALSDELDALLSGCAHDTAIVSHDAYAYLLDPRGLEQEGISGAGGHGDASPQRLAELTQRIRDESIPAVLAEPVEGRGDAEALANEAGVELLEIDPLEIGQPGLEGLRFSEALRAQAESFATALECG